MVVWLHRGGPKRMRQAAAEGVLNAGAYSR
jgi:hypothetical protein